ncbi:MAG: hypothetical protein ACI3WQ_02825 [Faecousia sp.]
MGRKRKASKKAPQKTSTATAMEVEIKDGDPILPKARNQGFPSWIIGLLVSLSPLAVIHFEESLNGGDMFLAFFSDVDIFFICVSMLVSASFEVISKRKNKVLLNGVLLLCIVFFALFYSQFHGTTLNNGAAFSIAIVTIISLVVTFLLGIIIFFSKGR